MADSRTRRREARGAITRAQYGLTDDEMFGASLGYRRDPYPIVNSDVLNYFSNVLLDVSTVIAEYEDFPETADRWYMERKLVETGTVAMYEAFDGDLVVTPWKLKGQYNLYGQPTDIDGFTEWKTNIDVRGPFVLGYDRQTSRSLAGATPTNTTLTRINYHARRMYELEQTRRQNLRAQRKPFILPVGTDVKTTKSLETFFANVESFNPVVQVAVGSDLEKLMKPMTNEVAYAGAAYLTDLGTLMNEALSELGISGASTKKERMITAELDLNRQQDNMLLTSRILAREEFVERCNKTFGINMSVTARTVQAGADALTEQAAKDTRDMPDKTLDRED